jgi:hypothetical protein
MLTDRWRLAVAGATVAVGVVGVVGSAGGAGTPRPGSIVTIAGSGGRTTPFLGEAPGRPATEVPLDHPGGVALDRFGTVYLTDVLRVLRVTDGTITTIAGSIARAGSSGDGGPAIQAKLDGASGLVVDRDGTVFFADGSNNRVRKIAPDGTITTVAGTGRAGFSGDGRKATEARLNGPAQVALDRRGSLYILDQLNHRVRKVTSDGKISTIAGPGGFGGLSGLAVTPDGAVFVADAGRVWRLGAGKPTPVAGRSFRGLDVGDPGFSGDGGPAIKAQVNYPEGLAVDAAGNLYIADTRNSRIRKVDTSGIITTIAGTGRRADSGDGGPAIKAELNAPGAVAVDSKGNVYIADTWNNRIRMIAATAPLPPPKAKPCGPDYRAPAGWTAHPEESKIKGDEPLNLIISACSTVSINKIMFSIVTKLSGHTYFWRRVGPLCVSAEDADVTGRGLTRQDDQVRLERDGESAIVMCVQIGQNSLAWFGAENHARLWRQPVPGRALPAWFMTASFETDCVIRKDGSHVAAMNVPGLLPVIPHFLDPKGTRWHCVNGGPGSLGHDGYNLGSQSLRDGICAAGKTRGWYVDYRVVKTPRGVGQNRVPYSGIVYVVRVRTSPAEDDGQSWQKCASGRSGGG